jgi:hypothetical protein
MSVAGWLNAAWRLTCQPELRRFFAATRQVSVVQARLLDNAVQQNRHTQFGRRYGFASIRTPREFQQRVPLSTYADYAEAIDRIAQGTPNVLTREPVLLLEPTSGTTSGEKLIPYTASLRREFQRGVAAWVADLFSRRPAAALGRAYWSISPAISRRRISPAGPPIGFDDDASYLSGWQQHLVRRVLAVPSDVSRIGDPDAFRYVTLLHLLAAGDVSLISIWSPTFLPALLAQLAQWQEPLCRDLEAGTCTPPARFDKRLQRRLASRPLRRRAAEVAAIFRSTTNASDICHRVWPKLALISAWADAAAAQFVPALQQLFPGVELQPKGLLATEGCITIPLVQQPSPVLAVRSHFFEFQPCNDDGDVSGDRCLLAHELCCGGKYRVVLTTGGGFYRYQLGDLIEVAGNLNEAPLLRFLGKADCVTDLVGEKLAEPFVRNAVAGVFAELGITPQFALLVPVVDYPPRYRLYYQPPLSGSAAPAAAEIARRLESRLRLNPYYSSAAGIGQLRPVEVACLARAANHGWQLYQEVKIRQGQKAGSLKPTSLDSWTGWPLIFDPICVV